MSSGRRHVDVGVWGVSAVRVGAMRLCLEGGVGMEEARIRFARGVRRRSRRESNVSCASYSILM